MEPIETPSATMLGVSTKVTDIMKALDDAKEEERMKGAQPQDPRSLFIDPFNVMNYVGPKQKPGAISYTLLRSMATVPAISAIINTRLNQVTNFTRRPRNDKDTGFRITTKDPDAKMDKAQQARAYELESFFISTGWLPNRKRKDNFNKLMRKVTRDSLTLDEVAIEVVAGMNARKYPVTELYAIDAATIEVVLPSDDEDAVVYEPVTDKGKKLGGEQIAYVQRVGGQVKAEYSEEDLIRAHRNPRTDIDYAYFGYSELEQLITIVTAMMNALNYNTTYFNNSNLPQGVLEIVGKYKPEHLEGFKRAWQTLVSGSVGKQWKVPVMAMEEGQGLKFTPFKNSNRDMEYAQFMEFLHNIACSVFQIDPREVGFRAFDSSNSKTMDSDAPATQLENSKDKGLFPLMQFFADLFNKEILERIAPDFRFEWVGLDDDRDQAIWAMEKDQLAAGVLTVEMYWKKHDIEPPAYAANQPWTQLPANTVLAGYITGQQQADQQQKLQQQQGQQQMDLQDQQHNQNLENTFVQGLHQSAQQAQQHKQAQELQGQQHGQQLEQNFLQGQQQAGLETQKQAGAAALADQQHGHALEQGLVQGQQAAGIEAQKQKGAQDMATMQHGHTMEQQAAQGQMQAGLQAQKDKAAGALQRQKDKAAGALQGQKDKAAAGMKQADQEHQVKVQELQHLQALEQLIAQGTQQAGLQSQKDQAAGAMADKQHEQNKEIAGVQHQQTLRQKFADEQYKRAGEGRAAKTQEAQAQANHERQKEATRLQHVLTLRQKMADAGHSRGLEAQKQRGAERQAMLKQEAEKAKKNNLKKSLEDDALEIIIELIV